MTMSRLALLHECGWWARPDVTLPPEIEVRSESTRGTAFAAKAEAKINGTRMPDPPDLPADESELLRRMWAHASAWIDEQGWQGWRAEVAFWWDPRTDTGGELPRGEHRDYSAAPADSLCGTADIVNVDQITGEVIIYDWKTRAPGAPEVDADHQLDGLALAAARAYGYHAARVVTLEVTADRAVRPIIRYIDVLELAEIASRIRRDLVFASQESPEPRDGSHCARRYCPALSVCPRTMGRVESVMEASGIGTTSPRRFLYNSVIQNPDHLLWMIESRAILRKHMERVDASIEAYVADGEKTASDGSVIRKTWRAGTPHLNRDAAIELMQRKGATEEEIGACFTMASRVSSGVRAFRPKGETK